MNKVCLSLSRKQIVCLLPIALILLLILIGVFFFPKDNTTVDGDFAFMRVHGSINYFEARKENIVSLLFVSTKEDIFSNEPISIDFGNDHIAARNISLSKGLSVKGYTLWNLNFTVMIDTDYITDNYATITSITLNSKYHIAIGNLIFNIVREESDTSYPLSLQSCSGASVGQGLRNYHATFKNQSESELAITKVDVPNYDKAGYLFHFDDTSEELNQVNGAIPIKPEESVQMIIDLSREERGDIDVYYVSPIVTYTYNNNEYTIELQYYTSGMILNETELLSIIKNLNWNLY